MTPPLVGIAAVNSLLFAANTAIRRLISPYPDRLSTAQIAGAGALAGAVQAVLASPVEMFKVRLRRYLDSFQVQVVCFGLTSDALAGPRLFPSQVRLQAQYGPNPKRLRDIVGEMYSKYGWKNGIMRGYWVSLEARSLLRE